MSTVATTATSFTAYEMLWSCIDVMACTNEIARPESAATATTGIETDRQSSRPCEVMRTSVSVSMARASAISHDKTVNQCGPAAHDDEQEQLERNRDVRRLDLVQAHRHQHVGDDEIDDDECDV